MKLRPLLLLLALAVLPLAPARAQVISGFGANGANFSLNKGQTNVLNLSLGPGPTVDAAGTTATLTSGAKYQGNALFSASTISVKAFNVSFSYQDVGANGSTTTADGFTFTLQNDSRGKTAVGYDGNQLGYGGSTSTSNNQTAQNAITPSVAVAFGVYGGSTTGMLTGGTVSTLANSTGSGTAGVLLYSGNVIRVALAYDGSTLTETLTDRTTNLSKTVTYSNVNLTSLLGGSSAYVGFTGASGASTATQTISDFSYTVVPEPSTWAAGALTLLAGGAVLRRRWPAQNNRLPAAEAAMSFSRRLRCVASCLALTICQTAVRR